MTHWRTPDLPHKTYVLDTNVLLHDPDALTAFEENDIVIPLVVIEEIDSQKKRQDEIGRGARRVAHRLDDMRRQGKLSAGVATAGGGLLRVQVGEVNFELPAELDPGKPDNQVIGVTLQVKKTAPKDRVILVSKDINVRVKAEALDVEAQDYERDKVVRSSDDLYGGMRVEEVDGEVMDRFQRQGFLPTKDSSLNANEFVHFQVPEQPSLSAIGRFDLARGEIVPLAPVKKDIWGITAKNLGQRFAFDALLNDDIKMVTLTGRAGTGKTLLALAAGLHKVLDEHVYRRLLVTRPVIPMGKDVGYLPGDKDEKLRPWMQPIYDNLEFLMSTMYKDQMVADMVHRLQDKGLFEVEALTYIRGRSIPQQLIIVDEAQNLTPHEVKTIVSRAGEGTKLVLTGDPYQIDHPYLDFSSNGLCYAVEKFKESPLAAHVTLTKGQRSELAELAAV
ncbi:MAG TPA: PhoH family protein, partial [Candidatus Dormibacteraeota bacterium]|nr:PhoH family protein [Candidatus Dormibacteraeota bacterium]